jgi:hypothetical protein
MTPAAGESPPPRSDGGDRRTMEYTNEDIILLLMGISMFFAWCKGYSEGHRR